MTIFHGCQIIPWDPRNTKIFVLKDKLNCTMKKCMASMATVDEILEHGGVQIDHISIVTYSRLLNMVSF